MTGRTSFKAWKCVSYFISTLISLCSNENLNIAFLKRNQFNWNGKRKKHICLAQKGSLLLKLIGIKKMNKYLNKIEIAMEKIVFFKISDLIFNFSVILRRYFLPVP